MPFSSLYQKRLVLGLAVLAALSVGAAGLVPERAAPFVAAPDCGVAFDPAPLVEAGAVSRSPLGPGASGDQCRGWPISLGTPGAGFPYTPTLYDMDGDGAAEIFLTGGNTFGLGGDGSFLPGWPTGEMQYMGYGTTGNMPGPSAGDMDFDGEPEVVWTERDWWAGGDTMWCFNGKYLDGSDMPGFPQQAPGQTSNALDTPFVLGDTDGDGDLEAWGAHTLGNNFTHYRVSAFDHLGTRLFTVDVDPAEDILSLYFGDVDGNGAAEMFGVSWLDPSYRLHLFEADGSAQPGYPIVLLTPPSSAYAMFGPPVPADLDGDGDLEILLGYNYGGSSKAECFHHDGSPYAGFPMQIATSSQLFYLGLGDVTADGAPELIAFENHLSGNYRVFVLDVATGSVLSGWPFGLAAWPKGFPTVVDVDGDGVQDICFATDGAELYAVSGAGQVVAGFPKAMNGPSISGVAAGDIDGDGLFELVAATWDGWVHAWDTPSPALAGSADWPLRGVNARNTGVYGAHDSPIPDIKVDGQDGPLTIPSTQTVSMTLELDAGVKKGEDHDWWIGAVLNGSALYCWSIPTGWTYCANWNPIRAYGGPLTDLDGYLLHQGTIPAGSWRFVFAIDGPNNLYEGTDKDTIQITSF